jgi:serine/threonine protein kinase
MRDQKTGQLVVVKHETFKETLSACSDKIPSHALREVTAWRHFPNTHGILPLLDSFITPGACVMVSPYCPLGDMLTYCETRELSPIQIRHFFQQMVEAVWTLHSKGFYHLDISFENFLVEERTEEDALRVLLCDFGSVWIGSQQFNTAGNLNRRGKCSYVSPEMWAYKPVNPELEDVYGLGGCLYRLITRKPPYHEPTARDPYFTSLPQRLVGEPGSLMHLLSRMLCPASQRYTLAQVRAHPFIGA